MKNTQPHFYEEHVQKSEKSVNLLDIIGKPIELASDLKQKGGDEVDGKLGKSTSAADVDELTSPVMAITGDDAKLELCVDVDEELTAMKGSASIDESLSSVTDDASAESRRRQFNKAKRPSDTCLESEY